MFKIKLKSIESETLKNKDHQNSSSNHLFVMLPLNLILLVSFFLLL